MIFIECNNTDSDVAYKISAGNYNSSENKTFYIAIRINKSDLENLLNNNDLYFSETIKKGEDAGYIYFALGVVKFVSGEVAEPATDKGFTLIHGDFLKTGTVSADIIRVGSDADRRLSEGEDANAIITENKDSWDNAATKANEANQSITDMSSDSKLTPVKKITLKRELAIATQQKTNAVNAANSITDTEGNTIAEIIAKANDLNLSYIELNNYVTELISDITVTTNINSEDLTLKFTNFYSYLNSIYDKINTYLNIARKFTDTVSENNYTEIKGGKIKTGEITGSTGKTVFDLNNDFIKVAEVIKLGKLPDNSDGMMINNDNLKFSTNGVWLRKGYSYVENGYKYNGYGGLLRGLTIEESVFYKKLSIISSNYSEVTWWNLSIDLVYLIDNLDSFNGEVILEGDFQAYNVTMYSTTDETLEYDSPGNVFENEWVFCGSDDEVDYKKYSINNYSLNKNLKYWVIISGANTHQGFRKVAANLRIVEKIQL